MALEAIQCLGGNGYINDYPTGRLLRDAKLYDIGAGTNEIRRMLIGREVFKKIQLIIWSKFMSEESIVLVSARRTPMGSFQGDLSSFKATDLGSIVVKQNLEDTKLSSEDIDEVVMGCVLPAGLGQAPARQVSIGAGIPVTVGATTINKMCGSGMKSIMMGYDSIESGTNKIVVAGGIESMSNAPYILPKG